MLYLLVFILAASYSTQSVELPAYLFNNRCSRSSATLEQCIIQSANIVVPRLAEGLATFNIPNMLPLKLKTLVIRDDQSLRFILRNVDVYGIERTKMTAAKLDFTQSTFTGALSNPKIKVSADYELNGHIANASVKGQGKVSITLVNGKYPLEMTFNLDEKHFAKNITGHVSYTTKKNEYQFTGLTIGNDSKEDTTNTFMNTHWKEVSSNFRQGASTAIANFVASVFQKLNDPFPMSDYFLP